ncbi:outer membrane beta-barrel protein [Gaoshiqia sp. Z1-71]|uniref:outer membrane beta-barrel protein n=1 Tax=Gaoshiqia hydrogeniformans TaxID=3290090 RepID=UPI003BF7BE20
MPYRFLIFTMSVFSCLLAIQLSFGQNMEGHIHSATANEPVPFANVVLYSLPDSSFITGTTTDVNGYFKIERTYWEESPFLLKISSIGFETTVITAIGNTGVVMLNESVNAMDEITVKGRRPVFKQIEGRLQISVPGTALSKAGNVFDVLRRSPGLLVDNNDKITVFGKGSPIIFLNGREIRNSSEIANLQSNDITSIEIDRNPSAEYSASGNAVVHITTKKITEDKLNFQLYNYSYFAKRYRNRIGANINGKSGNTDFTLNYLYGLYKYKNLEDAYEINTQPGYVINNSNSAVRLSSGGRHNWYGLINHAINNKHAVGAQVTLQRENTDNKSQTAQTIERTDSPTVNRDIRKKSDEEHNLSTYSLNYSFKIDSASTLSVIGDYSEVSDISPEHIEEYNLSDLSLINTMLESRNNYHVYSARVDFETAVLNDIGLKTGGKFSGVNKDGITTATNLLTAENKYTDINSINDRIAAGYAMLNYQGDNVGASAGLRYEHTSTTVKSDYETVVDSVYGNWFPSLSVNKEFSGNFSLTLSYNRKISRPAFKELSTDINYFDANSYAVGNPRLKPTIRNTYSLDLSLLRNLLLNAGYRNDINARIYSAVSDEGKPDIVKYTPVNIDRAQYLFVNIDYSLAVKWYGGTFSLNIEKPYIKIPFMDEIRKTEKLSYYFKVNQNFTLSERTSVFADYVYNSDNEDLMTCYQHNSNLSIGVNTSFFNNKLQLSLLANDIFNTSDTSWEDRYRNIIAGSVPDHDNSWIRLTVKYNFNNFKKGIQKKSASEDELERL